MASLNLECILIVFLGTSVPQPGGHNMATIVGNTVSQPGTHGRHNMATPPGNIGTAVNTLTARAQQHMRIFNYPKGKNRVAGKGKLPAKKIPTCTLKLFCLGNTGDEKPPSTGAAKTALSNCGLGPGNITIHTAYIMSIAYKMNNKP